MHAIAQRRKERAPRPLPVLAIDIGTQSEMPPIGSSECGLRFPHFPPPRQVRIICPIPRVRRPTITRWGTFQTNRAHSIERPWFYSTLGFPPRVSAERCSTCFDPHGLARVTASETCFSLTEPSVTQFSLV